MNDSSVIYRAIVTSKFRTEKMLNFYNSVGDGDEDDVVPAEESAEFIDAAAALG